MKNTNEDFKKWAAKLKDMGKLSVKTRETNKGEILVYLVKEKAKSRVIGKLFSISQNSELGKKLTDTYYEVHLKVEKNTKNAKSYRSCSLLVATKILLDAVISKPKKEHISKIKWVSSLSDKKDVERLQKVKNKFNAKDIGSLLQLKELAPNYQ